MRPFQQLRIYPVLISTLASGPRRVVDTIAYPLARDLLVQVANFCASFFFHFSIFFPSRFAQKYVLLAFFLSGVSF